MTSLQYTHKNNKRFTSTTRKNNKTNLKTSSHLRSVSTAECATIFDGCHLHSLDHTYSEEFIRQEFIRQEFIRQEFIRRMSEPIHFTI